MDVILQLLLGWLLAAVVIFIVGRLGLGLTVDGFVPALIAAAVIAIVSAVIMWLLGALNITIGGDFLGAIISLIVAAVVLLIADRFVPGMKVAGFVGAIIAAIAIGVVAWLVNWVLSLF
jgi:putative membrane protein